MIVRQIGGGNSRPDHIEVGPFPEDDYVPNNHEVSRDEDIQQVDQAIGFPLKSESMSPATSTSSPPSQRRSPINTASSSEENSCTGIASTSSRTYVPFSLPTLVSNSLVHPTLYNLSPHSEAERAAIEKLNKLKRKKRLKENRKESKNVRKVFQTEAQGDEETYSVDDVLQSLGEIPADKKGSRKSSKNGSNVVNGLSNGERKGRRRSNEKHDEDKKSSSDVDDEETASESGVDTSLTLDYSSSTVEFNHIQESFSRNVALVEESTADLRRQISRSTENLSSFTQVIKKQKRKRKPLEDGPQPATQRPANHFVTRSRVDNGGSLNGDLPSHEPITSRPEYPVSVQRSAAPNEVAQRQQKFPLVQSHSVDSGVIRRIQQTNPTLTTDLDLAADFPPLSDGQSGLDPGVVSTPNVWPLLKPSTSDPMAVIEPTSASENTTSTLPDLTVQANELPADFEAGTALPDVAAQASQNVPASATHPEPVPEESQMNTPSHQLLVDQLVRLPVVRDSGPVTFYKEEGCSWASPGDVTFGFDLNEDLLSKSFSENAEMASTKMYQILSLHQEDSAIVSFGESLEDLKSTVSPESGISIGINQTHLKEESIGSIQDWPQESLDSGASSWAEPADPDDDFENENDFENILETLAPKFNYDQILHFIRTRWMQVETELARGESSRIRYYETSVCY